MQMPLCGFAISEIGTPPNARCLGCLALSGIGWFFFLLIGLVVVYRLPSIGTYDAERAISTRDSEEATWCSISK